MQIEDEFDVEHKFNLSSLFANKWVRYGLFLFVIVAFLLLIVWLSQKRKTEDYTPTATVFLTQPQTQHFLHSDQDFFGRSLNQVNLEANGVVHHQDLLDKWSSSARDWTPEETKKLKDACAIVDYVISTKIKDPFKSQLRVLSWQLAKTIHPYYLDGLPHTREDLIFLTDKTVAELDTKQLARILLHEKAHIWSRRYPEEMKGWMERHNFKPVEKIENDGLQRRNPDVDEWTYENDQQKLLGVRFASTAPRDLHDVQSYHVKMDHPFEQFASSVEQYIYS
jgi:hypothetical protein